MGVPTLTTAGPTMPSRAGNMILRQVELDDFIATDEEDLVRKSVAHGGQSDVAGRLPLQHAARLERSVLGQTQADHGRPGKWLAHHLATLVRRLAARLVRSTRGRTQPTDRIMMSAQKNKPVYVTQPLLPPLEDFLPYLETIWNNKILTNGGPFHQQLEQALCDYLGVKHICLFANGTLALMTALQALRINGEVITTPYSFVATAHSLLWNNIKPVFVDIEAQPELDTTGSRAITTRPMHPPGMLRQVMRYRAIEKLDDNYL